MNYRDKDDEVHIASINSMAREVSTECDLLWVEDINPYKGPGLTSAPVTCSKCLEAIKKAGSDDG